MLLGHLHAEASPGRATHAAKQAAGKLLNRLKCPAFSPLDLHNGFPNTVRVGTLRLHSAGNSTGHMPQEGCKLPVTTWIARRECTRHIQSVHHRC